MPLDTWIAFFIASWAISLSPGAGAVASMTSGLNNGFARSYWTILGLQVGVLAQIAVVGAGLGAVLAASRLAFEMVKWSGVAYLVYLGVQQWRASPQAPAGTHEPFSASNERLRLQPPLELILRGFLVNASNPKATIFMLAVLPQFIDTARPLALQYLVITVTMVGVDVIVMGGYAGFAAKVLCLLREPRQVRRLNRVFGALFIAAAALLAGFRRGA